MGLLLFNAKEKSFHQAIILAFLPKRLKHGWASSNGQIIDLWGTGLLHTNRTCSILFWLAYIFD